MDCLMTSFEEFAKQLLEAEKEAEETTDDVLDTARKIVNIERQAFYGEEVETKRLSRIREILSEAVKREFQ